MGSEQPARPTGSRANGKVAFADESARVLLSGSVDQLCRPDEPTWRQVKHNTSRTVYCGHVGGQEIYLKHFHSRSIVHRGLRHLGSSDAMRELRFAKYLSSRGVPTAPALAAFCADGVEWLATQGVAPAQRVDAWHEQQLRRGRQGRRLICQATIALARLIGHMHAAGVVHRDLHCGNILVRAGDDPERPVELVLMDLHRAYRRGDLSRRAMSANLAQLYHDRHHLTTRTERLRFLTHYLRASGASGTLHGWHVLVERFAQMHTRRQHSQRDRRVLKHNRYFAKLSMPGGWRAYVVLGSKRRMAGSRAAEHSFRAADWLEALGRPESLLEGGEGEVVKDSRSSLVVRRRLKVGPHSLDVYVKRRRRKHTWKVVPDCFRPARAIRAFALGHALLTRRIATALPLAALERRSGPVLLDSILITEAVEAPQLNEFMERWLGVPPKGDTRLSAAEQHQLARDVLWQLGRLVQRLHDSRFAHRDLKATNMLVRWQVGASPEIVLVDLDGLTRRRVLTARRRFQGLMRLNVSLLKCPVVNRAGRLRMLMGYLRRPGGGAVHFKPYWRTLEDWSARKLRQQIRSRRRRQKAVRRPGP